MQLRGANSFLQKGFENGRNLSSVHSGGADAWYHCLGDRDPLTIVSEPQTWHLHAAVGGQ